MRRWVKYFLPVIFIGMGVLFFIRMLEQHELLHQQLMADDASAAELFQTNFYFCATFANCCFGFGMALVGRWWFR